MGGVVVEIAVGDPGEHALDCHGEDYPPDTPPNIPRILHKQPYLLLIQPLQQEHQPHRPHNDQKQAPDPENRKDLIQVIKEEGQVELVPQKK